MTERTQPTMDKELLKTLHIHSDDLPFIEYQPGIETRILQVTSDGVVATQIRAQPGAMSRLHRHPAPVYGWTISGQWGHDHQYAYRPGTYIFETPTVVHRFVNGPAVTEAVFISTGGVEGIDPETLEPINYSTPETMLQVYLAECEKRGLPAKYLS